MKCFLVHERYCFVLGVDISFFYRCLGDCLLRNISFSALRMEMFSRSSRDVACEVFGL